MNASTGAVFLSYASEDSQAAGRIAEALRSGGVEVWFDQSELRGGDAWDHKIREQIHHCRLFIPLISANTENRDEGYFRREWTLAADRTRDMAHKRTFLVPVVIDGTSERGASVPEKFHDLQWTRLPSGETPAAFVERIKRLLTPDAVPATTPMALSTSRPTSTPHARRSPVSKAAIWGVSAIAAVALAYLVVDKFGLSKHTVLPVRPVAPSLPQTTSIADAPAAFNPPPHSLAVLPFVNMSGDPKQEYLSDGLSEEILNSLARLNELHVTARTSAFSFKGKDVDVRAIARKLNVGAILEGSVRRSANTVRITTHLIDASSGYDLWSETYDRNLGDVLKLETEIATAVASALRLSLLDNTAQKIDPGGTRNPQALISYLRGRRDLGTAGDAKGFATAMADFDEALQLDPGYARAYAARSITWSLTAGFTPSAQQRPTLLAKSQTDARQAISLAPELADGYSALGLYDEGTLNPVAALAGYARATELAPGNADALAAFGVLSVNLGRTDQGLAALRRAVTLDPLNARPAMLLGTALSLARRYPEALQAFDVAQSLDAPNVRGLRGILQYIMGNDDGALASCQVEPPDVIALECQALVYYRLARSADAQAALQRLKSEYQDAAAYQYAEICAQWGDTPAALAWLERALQLGDTGLIFLKADALLDPLRAEPRFQAVMRKLKFPD